MKRGRDKFDRFKPIIEFMIKVLTIFPFRMRIKLFEHFRPVSGTKGLGMRYILLKTLAKRCGDNVSIQSNVYLFNPQNLIIGNNVSIYPMCYIECGNKDSGIKIGDDVSIAHGVTIMATSHKFDDLTLPIKDQGIDTKEVIIGKNVWIGAKATILYGTIIGEGSIIGANAVVTKNIENNVIVAGSPAKKIRIRGQVNDGSV